MRTDKFDQLMSERVRQSACPCCDGEEWTLMAVSDGPAPPISITLPGGEGYMFKPTGWPVVGLSCDHCGYVRLHSLTVLEEAQEVPLVSALPVDCILPAESAISAYTIEQLFASEGVVRVLAWAYKNPEQFGIQKTSPEYLQIARAEMYGRVKMGRGKI